MLNNEESFEPGCPEATDGRSPSETAMRIPAFILAAAFLMTGPVLDASAAREDLPGIGTFAYCGAPIVAWSSR
jgi:hypothetical protein